MMVESDSTSMVVKTNTNYIYQSNRL